jgi:hypothetical protein
MDNLMTLEYILKSDLDDWLVISHDLFNSPRNPIFAYNVQGHRLVVNKFKIYTIGA